MYRIKIKDNTYIRELTVSDSADIFQTIDTQREYLGRWLPFVSCTNVIADSAAFVESVVSDLDNRKELAFAIIADEQFAGLISFKDIDRANRKTEIGYWLGHDYQGQGIMTAAVETLCRLGFDELDINRIQIKCAVGNTRSSNIPRRLGFVFEGIERDGELQSDGKFSDLEIFSMLACEYQK